MCVCTYLAGTSAASTQSPLGVFISTTYLSNAPPSSLGLFHDKDTELLVMFSTLGCDGGPERSTDNNKSSQMLLPAFTLVSIKELTHTRFCAKKQLICTKTCADCWSS